MSDLAEQLKLAAEANRIKTKEIAQLRAELARLRPPPPSPPAYRLSLSVSPRRAVCVHGLQAFPTTLYKDQWECVLSAVADIRAFIQENDGVLITKAESAAKRTAKRTPVGTERRKSAR